MEKIKQKLHKLGIKKEHDDCVLCSDKLPPEELLKILCQWETGTVILEPQSRLNKGIYGYDMSENQLIYDAVKLAKCFDDWWCEDQAPTSEDPLERLDECLEWVYYNCNVGVKFIDLESSWAIWQDGWMMK